ncbi:MULTISPECIES: ABC transporter ATP-binding protein [unclassified Oceanobacter]|jgi:iron complex transport system ATP-binding protein|uniref:ABC transporter ATP-binding protein n=1 Tax=unclassified Oceanobacter TaxID=2620260 RepID=UPI0026E19687|nr:MULTISPECIES: ABC transporter ATP-binding protein [unclassified Oceanobacter]MDO6681509.1 ABC transporter ATP-binding protein [Oceanobacter sp. 5_MG-2023]MDP2506654.1 ABC transporter ATP-binding protein [Oceanobacter sp. 3_MG-2023]MDP2548679.1 ABC transporter ATP-binding protein [Oceanobacter sp. 4_MG-2023]
MNDIVMTVSHLTFRYPHQPQQTILNDISFHIGTGEVVSLLGANGCGKSTLLKLLQGLLQPTQGDVYLLGKRVQEWTRRDISRLIAYVPQAGQLPFPYRVRDLVAMGRIPHHGFYHQPGKDDDAAIDEAMQRLGISDLANKTCTELSGGQQQLCFLARALAQQTTVILMDEPVNGLDFGNQWRLLSLLKDLAADGYSIIKTTHYPDHALGLPGRAVLLHQGKILQQGPPPEVINPASIRTLYQLDESSYPALRYHHNPQES